jgi:hypothetical protein
VNANGRPAVAGGLVGSLATGFAASALGSVTVDVHAVSAHTHAATPARIETERTDDVSLCRS